MDFTILQQVYFGNTILDYLTTVGLFIVGGIIVKIIHAVVIARLHKWSESTKTTIDDFIVGLIQKVAVPLAYVGVFYLTANSLTLADGATKIVNVGCMAMLTLFAARFAVEFISYAFNIYWVKRGKDMALERSLKGILNLVKFLVWGIAVIFFLDNLGFEISAVIAGLGIGGVAVALAAQAVLGDLFSYFAIIFDRPFEIGDFIIVGDYMGVVDHIGIKTTRITSLGGEQLVFSNTDLTNSRVRNYRRMAKRRVVFKLGVTYDTSLEKVKEIPGAIENIIKGVKDTTFDRAHFFSYGDFSLIYEVVYYVNGSDYNVYMDIQQQINFAIKEAFDQQQIDFAFPTQTLHVNKAS